MEVTKEMFNNYSPDQKMEYMYEILNIICKRLDKVEKNKWLNRVLIIIAYGAGGAITALAALFVK